MGAKARAKDAAKRYLSPDAQEAVKTLMRRAAGPRKPSRLKPPPTDPEGAARHAVLIAHASGRAPDHARARKAMGHWVLTDPTWSVGLPRRTAPDLQATPIDVVIVGARNAAAAPTAEGEPEELTKGTVLSIGLPGAADADVTPLPYAAELLATLGADEQAAVLTAAAMESLRGLRVRSVTAMPSDDPVASVVARSLQELREGPHA